MPGSRRCSSGCTCRKHTMRNSGQFSSGPTRLAIDRFNEKWVEDENGCHVWIASTSDGMTGQFSDRSKAHHMYKAHRWIWEHVNGPIPDGHDVHHTCFEHSCVNVAHMELKEGTEHDKMHTIFKDSDSQREMAYRRWAVA